MNGCMSLYLLLYGINFCASFARNYVRQNTFDGFECAGIATIDYGTMGSKIACSKECTKDATCNGFFFNVGDFLCHGSIMIPSITHGCISKAGTVHYVDATCKYSPCSIILY